MNDREQEKPAGRSSADDHTGPLGNRTLPLTRWLFTNLLAAPIVLIFFGLLTRTRIYGRPRVPLVRNTLLVANHQSMVDSFPIGYAAFFPANVIRPYLVPWNPAAQENFFKNPVLAWIFHQFKCIPVRPGRRDLKAMNRSVRGLRDSTMVLFPEGTRSRDGTMRRGRPGPGLVILETRPKVVPVTIEGMNRVLPIGARFPRIGQRVSIYFGHPIDYDDLVEMGRSREVAQKVVDRVMDRIAFQRRVLARLRPESRRG